MGKAKPEIGQVLEERYLLERVIGQGGMGVVFAARHLELGEPVAVKVLHPVEGLEGDPLERFLREARLASKIKNEHVVRVLDVGRGKGDAPPFIVMEYLEGMDLADLVRVRGPLPASEAVDYILQAAEAVAEAHTLGIVHRDLKPSNLLLTQRSDGTATLKVLDFGISKSAADGADNSKLTTTSAVFGSPAYMSPEQIRSAKHVDARSDVWALAVVLFEILTGRLPFIGDTATAILAAVAADPPLALNQFAPASPPGLQQAIEACLVKDRDRRVPTVAEMAMLLAPFATSAGVASIEAVRRITSHSAIRNAYQRQSGSMPPAPVAANLSTGGVVDATVQSPFPPDQSNPSNPIPFDPQWRQTPQGVGRTDRGVVVASRRAISSRASVALGIAVGLGLAAVITTAVLRRGATPTSPSISWPDPPPPSAATSLPPPPAVPAGVAAPDNPLPAPPPTTPPAAPSPRPGFRHPRPHSPPVASALPSASAAPAVPRPVHVDTDSRQ